MAARDDRVMAIRARGRALLSSFLNSSGGRHQHFVNAGLEPHEQFFEPADKVHTHDFVAKPSVLLLPDDHSNWGVPEAQRFTPMMRGNGYTSNNGPVYKNGFTDVVMLDNGSRAKVITWGSGTEEVGVPAAEVLSAVVSRNAGLTACSPTRRW
ncbi:hypothetical protein BE20_04790 [Sorangium cellulosum]|nr:hypothetical protein BE20_04790 [Sorangium cellulosum]